MESKVFIDIDSNGNPQIRMNLHYGDDGDVRDKLLHRFLDALNFKDVKSVPVRLVLGHHHEHGMTAFITNRPDDGTNIEKDTLDHFDSMCLQSLDPVTFEKWEQVKSAIMKTRQAFK